ncbi:MAG: ribosome biogenesis GTP-binding protein YsxC [Bacteriovoracaceae bacterium]|nr:ribosome biogenesis GTP-binding protein YsxC [Bacteriovoracaceae bacterium]
MQYEILKGSAKFCYGISDPAQLVEWFQNLSDRLIGVCFVGRSNVGKSSLINSLFGKRVARTSKTPGRTRMVNIFTFDLVNDGEVDNSLPTLYLFDLPGYGHANVSKEMSKNWDELMSILFESIGIHMTLVNIQDARHPGQKADLRFRSFINKYNFPTINVLNKIDKLKTQKERAQLAKLKKAILAEDNGIDEVMLVSAEKGTGTLELQQSIIDNIIQAQQLH